MEISRRDHVLIGGERYQVPIVSCHLTRVPTSEIGPLQEDWLFATGQTEKD